MRLLLLNYEYPPLGGGAASFTRCLAEELARGGDTVTVLTARHGDLPRREQPLPGLDVVRVAAYRRSAGEATVAGMLSFSLAAARRLPALLAETRPEVCLAFFGIPGGPVALYARRRFGLPYILCLRGGDVPGFSPAETGVYHRLLAPLERHIWAQAGVIVANSRGLRDLALRFDARQPIEIITNGVDSARFAPGAYAPAPGELRLLFVGRLAPQKNVLPLVTGLLPELARALAPRAVRLTVVGEGPLAGALREAARQRGLAELVTFRGWLAREELPALYAAHDLLVLPSLYEGMSNVVMEAKACGLPVAGFAIAGNEEMLEPERDLCAAAGDTAALTAAIAGWSRHPAPARGVSDRFRERFSLAGVARQYRLLAARCAAAAV